MLAAAGALLVGGIALLRRKHLRSNVIPPLSKDVQVISNLCYSSLDPACVLDLYLPADRSAPLLVFIHGGLFVSGDKADGVAIARYFAARGYAVACVNYRLSSRLPDSAVKHPAHTADVTHALQWLASTQQVDRYGYDMNHVVLLGHSVGAYVAALICVGAETFPLNDMTIRGVIGVDGIYSMTQFYDEDPRWRTMVDAAMPDDRDDWLCPLLRASAKDSSDPTLTVDPAWLLLHSLEDPWVPRTQTECMAVQLLRLQFDVHVVFQDRGGDHDASLQRIGAGHHRPAGARRGDDSTALIETFLQHCKGQTN